MPGFSFSDTQIQNPEAVFPSGRAPAARAFPTENESLKSKCSVIGYVFLIFNLKCKPLPSRLHPGLAGVYFLDYNEPDLT